MSRETTITCGGCGCSVTAEGYSTLWADLRKRGWTRPARKTHFCKKCSVLDLLQKESEKLPATAEAWGTASAEL